MTDATLEHQARLVGSFDGTAIAARRMGADEGTPILLVPALGAGLAPWRDTLHRLAPHRPIITWDLRGLGESEEPFSDRLDAAAHAEDALAVLSAEGIQDFSIVSWSTGCPIAIELAAHEPDRVQAVALVSGGHGHALRRLFRYLEVTSVFPVVAGVAKHFSGPIQGIVRRFADRPELGGIVRQSGFVAPSVDLPAFLEMLQTIAESDMKTLLGMYEQVVGDSVFGRVASVQAPSLLLVGERDQFTPLRMVQRMQRAMPNARLDVYEGSTHFLPFEQPARLADDLAAFLP